MKRPEEHETDEKGNAIFRRAFAEWGVNPTEKDYGRDYVVEVFRNRTPIGLLFNAQLKSSTVSQYSAEQKFISQPLDKDAAEYLAMCLQQPTFLFHADVEKGQLFWSAIQLDQSVVESLERGETRSLTVRIPTANLLPDNFERFLYDLSKAHHFVVSRALLIASDTDFVEAMRGRPVEKIDDLTEDLHEKAFRLEMQTAHTVFQEGNLLGAIKRIEKVLASPTASLHVRFNATLQLGELDWVRLFKSGRPQIEATERKLATGQQLCSLAKKGPKHLRLFALITRTAGELGLILHKHHGLTMNWVGHKRSGDDPLWLTVLAFRLERNLVAAGRKYKQALRLARLAARSPYRSVVPRAIVTVAREIPLLADVLDHSELHEVARQYRNSAFQLLRMAGAIATENKDDDSLFQAVMSGSILDPSEGGEVYTWVRSTVDSWDPESEYRKRADDFMRRTRQRREGVEFEGDIRTNPRQIHENLLAAFGIDPASQPWVDLIELAVKDGDPSRALKHCEHTFVAAGPGGNPMLMRLGLRAAGPKTLHCTLHKYAVTGSELDTVYQVFTQQYCNSCKEKSARPPDWRFSSEWEEEEHRRWQHILEE